MDLTAFLYIIMPMAYAIIFFLFYTITEYVTNYLLVEHRERLWIIHVCVLFGSIALSWLIKNLHPAPEYPIIYSMIKFSLVIYLPSFVGVWVGSHGAKKTMQE
jgi:hypothetical protein